MSSPIIQENPQVRQLFGDVFERQILAALCQNSEFLSQYAHIIQPKYFASSTIKSIVSNILSYYQQYTKSPTKDEIEVTINKLYWQPEQKELRAVQKELLDQAFSTTINLDFIKDNLQNFMVKAEMGSLIYDAIHKFEELEPGELQKRVEKVSEISVAPDLGVGLDAFVDQLLTYDDTVKYQTSFPSIDKMLRGGIKPGELLVIMAPTNRGKSQTIVNFSKGFLYSGANVLHITIGDMYEEDVIERYLASMGQLSTEELMEAKYVREIYEQIQSIKVITDKSLRVKYFNGEELSVFELEGFIRQLHSIGGFKTEVLVIDYADLMKPTNAKLEKRHQLSQIYVGLRALGRKFNIPVITASQTNRAGERVDFKTNREVVGLRPHALSTAHIAEDYGKAANADYIVSLRRPTPYSKLNADEQILIIDVTKSRHSRVGVEIPMKINFTKCYMEEYPLNMPDYLNELATETASPNLDGVLQ